MGWRITIEQTDVLDRSGVVVFNGTECPIKDVVFDPSNLFPPQHRGPSDESPFRRAWDEMDPYWKSMLSPLPELKLEVSWLVVRPTRIKARWMGAYCGERA